MSKGGSSQDGITRIRCPRCWRKYRVPVERLGAVVRCAVCTQIFLLGIRPDDPSFDESELVEFDLVREGGLGPLVTPAAGVSNPTSETGAGAESGGIEALPEKIPVGITDRPGLFTREQIQARVAQVKAAMAAGDGTLPPLTGSPAGHHLLHGGDFDSSPAPGVTPGQNPASTPASGPGPTSPAATSATPVQETKPVAADQGADLPNNAGHDSDALAGELDQLDRDLRAFEDALNMVGAAADEPILARPIRNSSADSPEPTFDAAQQPTQPSFDHPEPEQADHPQPTALPAVGHGHDPSINAAGDQTPTDAAGAAGEDTPESTIDLVPDSDPGNEPTKEAKPERNLSPAAGPVPGDAANPPSRPRHQPRTILVPQSTKHSTAAARPMPRPIVAGQPEVVKEAVAAFLADQQPPAAGKLVDVPSSPPLVESPPLGPNALADLEQQLEELRKQQRAKIRQLEEQPETTGARPASSPGSGADSSSATSGNGKPGHADTNGEPLVTQSTAGPADPEADRDVDFWRQSIEALADSMPDDEADEPASQPANSK